MITDFITNWHAHFMNVERIPAILMALLLCVVTGMITGPLVGNANPFMWVVLDKLFGKTGARMDKPQRKRGDLVFRGLLLSVFVIAFAGLIGQMFEIGVLLQPLYGGTRVILLALLMTSGSVWFALLRLYFAEEQGKVGEGAYYAIARSARVNLAMGDDYGITRTAMAYSVRSFDKGLVAPALWYILAGFPAATMYAALAFLSWRFGKNGKSSGFAAVPLALERLTGMVPSFISAAFITMAALFTPTAKLHSGIASWLGHKDRAPYDQGGAPVSALAWGLNISVGGPVHDLNGDPIKGDWVGPKGATAKLDHKHLRRAIYINVIAHILFVASLLGAYIYGQI